MCEEWGGDERGARWSNAFAETLEKLFASSMRLGSFLRFGGISVLSSEEWWELVELVENWKNCCCAAADLYHIIFKH